MIAMVAALNQELAGLKRRTDIEEHVTETGRGIYRGMLSNKEVVLAFTGMGRERAESAAVSVLERYPVGALISFGFAGSLLPGLRIGEIVLCSSLCAGGQKDACQSDAGLLSRSLHIRVDTTVRQGKCVTVDELASPPEVRQALARSFHADVVDMESYWIARIASARRVPFLVVRAISDTPRDVLPPFQRLLDSDGRPQWPKFAPYFLVHPGQIALLARLYRNSRKAETSLTAFLLQLVEQL